VKNLRKRQIIILLIALIIVFYFLIHPEYGFWNKGWESYEYLGGHWLWEETYSWSIMYSKMILKVIITCLGTGIVLFIENLIYLKKRDN